MPEAPDLTTLTADIVSAYLVRQAVPAAELPALMRTVRDGLVALDAPAQSPSEHATPAEIRKSVQPDGLISFIDGRPYRSLKRHLRAHGLDPAGYRQRYGLPSDYPMVCASYSSVRSEIAREMQFGHKGAPQPRKVQPAAE